MGQTRCDVSNWPVIHFALYGAMNTEQVNVVVNGLRNALARKEAFATVTDLSGMDSALKVADDPYRPFLDKNRDELRKYCRGGALVVNSLAMRVVINTFVLVAKLPFPTRAFNSQQEAVAWCTELLRHDKLAVS